MEIVGCKLTAAVHFSPSFGPIAGLWGCKSDKNCPRRGQFSHRRSKSDSLLEGGACSQSLRGRQRPQTADGHLKVCAQPSKPLWNPVRTPLEALHHPRLSRPAPAQPADSDAEIPWCLQTASLGFAEHSFEGLVTRLRACPLSSSCISYKYIVVVVEAVVCCGQRHFFVR